MGDIAWPCPGSSTRGAFICLGSWLRENAEAKPAVRILFRHQANRTRDLRRNCLALFAVFYSSWRLSSKRCSDETHSELTKKKDSNDFSSVHVFTQPGPRAVLYG